MIEYERIVLSFVFCLFEHGIRVGNIDMRRRFLFFLFLAFFDAIHQVEQVVLSDPLQISSGPITKA